MVAAASGAPKSYEYTPLRFGVERRTRARQRSPGRVRRPCYHGKENVVSCEFYADGSSVPDIRYGGCRVGLAYPWSRFSAVLDPLRNEKPLHYGFIFGTKVGCIATQQEPVGEGEV